MPQNPEILKKLLEKLTIPKSTPTSEAAGKKLASQKSANKEKPEYKKKAEEKSGQQESVKPVRVKESGGQPESSNKAHIIQDKFKEQLDRQGRPLSVEDKLRLIGQEIPRDASASLLNEKFQKLRLVTEGAPASPAARREIEQVIAEIPDNVYWDKNLGGVAEEIRQAAFNQIIRDPGYMVDITMDQRIATGKSFKGARADRVYEDEAYLHAEVPATQEHIAADRQLAKDIEALSADEGRIYDVEAVLRTVRPTKTLDLDTARRKIDKGPEWVKKAAERVSQNPHAATMLAELADAATVDPEALNDPAYIYMKAAQVARITMDAPIELQDAKVANEVTKVNHFFSEQGKISSKVSEENLRNTLYPEQREGMARTKEAPEEYKEYVIPDDVINTVKDDEFKKRLIHLNNQLKTDYGGDRSQAIYKLISDIDNPRSPQYLMEVINNRGLLEHMEKLRLHAAQWGEQHLERGWSNFYLSYEYMMRSWKDPKALAQELQDEQNMYLITGTPYPGFVPEGVKRIQANYLQYVTSIDYQNHRMAYLKNSDNWDSIPTVDGQPIKGDNGILNTEHPWYKEVDKKGHPADVDKFKIELNRELSTAEALSNTFLGWITGTPIEELKKSYINLGDDAPCLILLGRPINVRIWNMMQRRGREIMKWEKNGKPHSPDARSLKRMRTETINEAKAHRNELEAVVKKIKGEDAVVTDQDIEHSVNEVYMLTTVLGRRATLVHMGLTPQEAKRGAGSPVEFGGTGSDDQLLGALAPIRDVILRWKMQNQVDIEGIREMGYLESGRYGIDKFWSKKLDHMDKWKRDSNGKIITETKKVMKKGQLVDETHRIVSDEFKNISEWAFYITEPDNPKNVENCLTWLAWNPDGSQRIAAAQPKTLEQLTTKDLKDWIIVREGIELLDARSTGAYNYTEWGVNLETQMRAYEARYNTIVNYDLIAVHEQAKIAVGNYLNDGATHEKLKETREKLMQDDVAYDKNQPETGLLPRLARADPLSIMEAGYEKGDEHARKAFRKLLPLANDIHTSHTGIETATEGRIDLVVKDVHMIMDYTDEICREGGRGPADWSMLSDVKIKGAETKLKKLVHDGASKENISRLRERIKEAKTNHKTVEDVCTRNGYKSDKVIQLMDQLSDYALNPETLEIVSSPSFMTHFVTVNYAETRFADLDSVDTVFIPKEARVAAADAKWSELSSKSEREAGNLLSRWAGDTGNAKKGADQHLVFALEATDLDTFLNHLKAYVDTVRFSGGDSTKAMMCQSLWQAVGGSGLMDWERDALGTDTHKTYAKVSKRERAGGKGQITFNRKEYDEASHKVEAIAGWDFHKRTPGVAHQQDKQNKTGFYIGKLRIPTIRLYNAYAFVLLGGAVLGLAAAQNFINGFKQGSGGKGGGGGEDSHHG